MNSRQNLKDIFLAISVLVKIGYMINRILVRFQPRTKISNQRFPLRSG
jgi:hypothetical protein